MVLKIGAKVDSEVLNKCSLQNKIKIAAALTNSTDFITCAQDMLEGLILFPYNAIF